MRCIHCKNWDASVCKYHRLEDLHIVDGYLDMHRMDCMSYENEFITPDQYKERTGREFTGVVWVVTQSPLADTGDYTCGLELMTYQEYRDDKDYLNRYHDMPLPLCVLSEEIPDPEEDFNEYP